MHPLNPLPDPSAPAPSLGPAPSGTGGDGSIPDGTNTIGSNGDTPHLTSAPPAQPELHPIAPEAFYQVINTQPLPSLISAQNESVARASVRAGWGFNSASVSGSIEDNNDIKTPSSGHITLDEPTLRRLLAGLEVPSIPESRGGNGPALVHALRERLVDRLKREEGAAKRLREVVQEKEEEYDWAMRIDDEVLDGDGQAERKGGEGVTKDEDEEDLFGDDEEVQIIPPSGTAKEAKAVKAENGGGAATGAAAATPNPRSGWTTADYIKYMDTGRIPPSATA